MEEDKVTYKHTQPGRLMVFVLIIVVVLFLSILKQADYEPFILGIMAFVLVIIASFSSLSAIIDENHVRIKFGYGIFRKQFPLSGIASVKTVRNHWYYGWGVRYWFWPRMWIFNVSGFDAVELSMKNGKIYRIGTDEPNRLLNAVTEALNKKEAVLEIDNRT